jgi:hypothetical protein
LGVSYKKNGGSRKAFQDYHRCTPNTPIKDAMGFHSHFEHCFHVGHFTLRSGRCEKSIWQINDIFFYQSTKQFTIIL